MADIELAGAASGVATLQVDLLAAIFLEAAISPAASVTGNATEGSVEALAGSSSGVASVSATGTAGAELGSHTDGAGSASGTVGRQRDTAGSALGVASLLADLNQRRGLGGTVSGLASLQATLGRNRPMAATVSMAAAPAAAAETVGYTFQDIYLQVTGTPTFNNDANPATGDPGSWTLPVTLRRGGTNGTRIPTGSALVKWGQYAAAPTTEFTGGIILTSDLSNAPYIDVFTVAKNVGGTVFPWSDAALKPRVRMGNLRGVLGNSTDLWGIAMSTDLSDVNAPYLQASNQGLTIKDAGVNIVNGQLYVGDAGNTKFMQWDGAALIIRGEIRADTGYLKDLTISGTLRTAASPNPRIEVTPTQIAGYSDATTKQFYLSATDGAAYAGAGNVMFGDGGIKLVYNSASDRSSIRWFETNSFATEVARIEATFANPLPRLKLSSQGNYLELGGPRGAFMPTLKIDQLEVPGTLAGASAAFYCPVTLLGIDAPAAPSTGWGRIYWSNTLNWPIAQNASNVLLPLGETQLVIPLAGVALSGATPGSDNGTYYIGFRDGVGDSVLTTLSLPGGWYGRYLSVDLYWYGPTSNAQNVVWQVDIRTIVNNGGWPTSSSMAGNATANSSLAIKRTSIGLGTWGPASSPAAVQINIWRNGTSGNDTYTQTARLVAARIYAI